MPKTLYKYRPFRTEEQRSQAIGIMFYRHFWFARADLVNDPFEYLCSMDPLEDPDAQVEAFYRFEMSAEPTITEEEAKERVLEKMTGVPAWRIRQIGRKRLHEFWRIMCSDTYMCSFGGNPASILMWSHYADGHSGICVEVAHSCLDDAAMPVTYTDEVFRITPHTSGALEVCGGGNPFLRKASCWSYEEEYRMVTVDPNGGIGGVNVFPEGCIKRIIFGAAMPPLQVHGFIKLLKEKLPEVGIAWAHAGHDGRYEVTIRDITPDDFGELDEWVRTLDTKEG